MSSSDSLNGPSDDYRQYEKATANDCQEREQINSMDHSSKHHRTLQEHFDHVMHTKDLVRRKLKSLISQVSSDDIFDLIEPIYEWKMMLNNIEKSSSIVQEQFKDLLNKDKQDLNNQSTPVTNESKSDQKDTLQKDIKQLKQDIEDLQEKIDDITKVNKRRVSDEQSDIIDTNVSSDNQPRTIKSLSFSGQSSKKKCPVRSVVSTWRKSISQKGDNTPALSRLLVQQMSPSILDLKKNNPVVVDGDDKTHSEDEEYEEEEDDEEEEVVVLLDANKTSKITHKVHLNNNIVRYLRGPLKVMVNGTMHAFDLWAQGTHISAAALEAVKRGVEKQKQRAIEQQTTNNSVKPTFTEITPDWKYEGENADQGYSSPSIWMRDPEGRRVLVKTAEHPLCAANEWLAYVLGRFLGLPVNEVQIAVYENSLVTLHTDIAQENEKTVTYMDLPRQKRKALMTDPIMERMDIFDRIIQNVDRNQRNILITMPKTTDMNDNNAKFKVYLIDHSSCFGMGKLNAISLVASKFHSHHLAVVKFDPIHKSKQFEQYLNKLPVADRPLISNTLNRFAALPNEQVDSWIVEIQDLLSSSQYNRIHGVLYRQRDIAKRYTIQWGISSRSSSVKSNERKQRTSTIDDTTTF